MKLFFINPDLDEQLCSHIFDEIDTNKDGKIDFQEFTDMMIYD